jgi:type III secretory pathway component EscR
MKQDKIYWTQKNGEKIDVDEMTEEHLRNTLKMLIRKEERRQFFEDEKQRQWNEEASEIDIY